MSVKLETSSNPYIMDYILYINNKIPALTRKNADFIEAIVRLDSNYAKESIIVPPTEGFNPEINYSGSKGMYSGSIAYWFHAMRQEIYPFPTALLGAIIAVDRSNSTHLESSISGRLSMRDRICEICNNLQDFITEIEKEFYSEDNMHLISILSAPIPAKGKNGVRLNVSFASKFCDYASIYLGCQRKYSKYDDIVSAALPSYAKIYLNRDLKKNEFKVDNSKQSKMKDEEKLKYRLQIYEKYYQCIGTIIQVLKDENISLSREEFDHIIWYGFKG